MATRSAQHDLSAYILTIAAINAVFGLFTAAASWWLGVSNPLLWGAGTCWARCSRVVVDLRNVR